MVESKKYDIQVVVEIEYLFEQFDVVVDCFVFVYYIMICNIGIVLVQLILCYWVIIDVDGDVQEVKGLGVVGYQLLLVLNQEFEYISGCVLMIVVGIMCGIYQMMVEDGIQFEVEILEFVLLMLCVLY